MQLLSAGVQCTGQVVLLRPAALKVSPELPHSVPPLMQLTAAARKMASSQGRRRQREQMQPLWVDCKAAAGWRQAVRSRQLRCIGAATVAMLAAQMGSTRGRAHREVSVAGSAAH